MSTPLRELLNGLLLDPTTRSAFDADPQRFLADNGWADLDGHDVASALGALVHELPVDQAVRIAPVVADGSVFDDPGLDGAIAGLGAARAAFDAPGLDDPQELDAASDLDDPAGRLDELASAGALGDVDGDDAVADATDDAGDDPAAGIDAGEGGPVGPDAVHDDGEAEPDAADDTTGWDAGDGPEWGSPGDGGAAAATDDGDAFEDTGAEDADADDGPGVAGDGSFATDAGFGEPASFDDDDAALDGGGGLSPYDPTEVGAEVEESDDGFPY